MCRRTALSKLIQSIRKKQKYGAKNFLKESMLLIDIQAKLEDSRTHEQISGRAKLNGL